MRIGNMKLTAKMPKKYDFWLHFSSLLMILFGTLMIISTNLGNVQDDQLIKKAGISDRVCLDRLLDSNSFDTGGRWIQSMDPH